MTNPAKEGEDEYAAMREAIWTIQSSIVRAQEILSDRIKSDYRLQIAMASIWEIMSAVDKAGSPFGIEYIRRPYLGERNDQRNR